MYVLSLNRGGGLRYILSPIYQLSFHLFLRRSGPLHKSTNVLRLKKLLDVCDTLLLRRRRPVDATQPSDNFTCHIFQLCFWGIVKCDKAILKVSVATAATVRHPTQYDTLPQKMYRHKGQFSVKSTLQYKHLYPGDLECTSLIDD